MPTVSQRVTSVRIAQKAAAFGTFLSDTFGNKTELANRLGGKPMGLFWNKWKIQVFNSIVRS